MDSPLPARSFTGVTPALVVRRGTGLHGVGVEPQPMVLMALPEAPLRWPKPLRPLAEAWKRLAQVRYASPEVLADVLHVLLETVSDPELEAPACPLVRLEVPRAISRTAAHPRAFRGTHAKPLRASMPAPIDIRPALAHARHRAVLLESLLPFLTHALDLLRARHFDSRKLIQLQNLLHERGPGIDVALAYHHGLCALPQAPRLFALMLPLLKDSDRSTLQKWIGLAWALEIPERPNWLGLFMGLVARSEPVARAWAELCITLPLDKADAVLRVAFSQRAPSPEALQPWLGTLLERWCPVPQIEKRLKFGVRALHANFSTQTVNAAFDFIFATQGIAPDVLPKRDVPFPFAALLAARERSQNPGAPFGWTVWNLWAAAGELPELSAFITELLHVPLPPSTTLALALALNNLNLDRPTWPAVKQAFRELASQLASVPEPKHDALIGLMTDLLESAKRRADALPVIQRMLELGVRVPELVPFERRQLWRELLALANPVLLDAVLASPQTLRALARAHRRDNDANRAGRGLNVLLQLAPMLALEGLVEAPAATVDAARVLGTLASAAARTRLRHVLDQPLFIRDPLARPLSEACTLLDGVCGASLEHPMPRALRAHIRGVAILKPGQVERHLAVTREGLIQLRMRAIERDVLQGMRGGLQVDLRDVRIRHALQLASCVESNRPALKRFLAAHLSGHGEPAERHPANRAWLARHPRIDASRWLQGTQLEREMGGVRIRVQLEHDPLEVLRLGSYVGSCLGLGGGNEPGAAAAMLDVNKRVAYARDTRGRVLARQLLAINAAERLVCHEVYPVGTSVALQTLIRDFDLQLAAELGLKIAERSDAAAVECVVAQSWYDDGAWDLVAC